jgi:hypothetical protein
MNNPPVKCWALPVLKWAESAGPVSGNLAAVNPSATVMEQEVQMAQYAASSRWHLVPAEGQRGAPDARSLHPPRLSAVAEGTPPGRPA